jgi:glucose-6-phosphate 1-dehydrogenase
VIFGATGDLANLEIFPTLVGLAEPDEDFVSS